MPVDRTLAEDLARALVELYGAAEQRIATDLARRLKSGFSRSDWADQKLGSINDLRNAIQRLIRKLDSDTTGLVEQAIVLAFSRGGKAALDELAKSGGLPAEQVAAIRQSLPGAEAINRLVFALVSTLRATHLRILRWAEDAYREVIATVALPAVLLGTTTRLAAAQQAWDRLLSRGITGFVDKRGYRYDLASYTEMATRTGVAQAAVQSHLDRLGEAGLDLVIVSNAPQECRRCRPLESRVLDRTTPGRRTVEMEHATIDGRMVRVDVWGSVAEAVEAGLMHPNCRHSLSLYLPGVTKAPTHTEDPEGDAARQKLRALERKVREWKLREAGALNDDGGRRAAGKVREYQSRIRKHVTESGLHRQRHREQIGQAR